MTTPSETAALPGATPDNPSSRKQSESIEVTPSSGNVFADLGLPNPEAELRAADARLAGLADPIEAALDKLVTAVALATDRHGPGVAEALQAVRDTVRDQPAELVGRPMSTAPRDGFAFLATGVHTMDDPPGAERGVKAGMPWWGIVLFDVWREPHRFVFAKDGKPLWSEPQLWCVLPNLVGLAEPVPALPSDGTRALIGAFYALRSYQYGNSARDLAEGMADHCAQVLSDLGVQVKGGVAL